jgi:hypothetical protein
MSQSGPADKICNSKVLYLFYPEDIHSLGIWLPSTVVPFHAKLLMTEKYDKTAANANT